MIASSANARAGRVDWQAFDAVDGVRSEIYVKVTYQLSLAKTAMADGM